MSAFEVRAVAEGERRVTFDLVGRALHVGWVSDGEWAVVGASWPAARKFGAFAGGVPVGVVSSFGTELAVPGGRVLPVAAVEGVAVRADWTRRGVLRALMGAQLADFAARGVPVAVLHASEPTIYGRFGYGPAVLGRTVRVARPVARWRAGVPVGGRVRVLSPEAAVAEVPGLYERIGLHRPGMVGRPGVWWPVMHDRQVGPEGTHVVVVHCGPEGDDGFAVYETVSRRTPEAPDAGVVLKLRDLHAADPVARAGLWRFLLSVDLVSEVLARARPVDEPLPVMLVDQRHARTSEVGDDLWVRLVDVGAALAGRGYREGPPVVLGVSDGVLPANGGCYEVGASGVRRTSAAAQLGVDVEALAMLYLGQWSASALAEAGRVEVHDPGALGCADELFTTVAAPWCGTLF